MSKLFRHHDVWRRHEKYLVRYRCLEDLETGRFAVQSADRYHPNVGRDLVEQHENQFRELLFEEDPFVRSEGAESLKDAIESFEASVVGFAQD